MTPSIGIVSFTYEHLDDAYLIQRLFAPELHSVADAYQGHLIGVVVVEKLQVRWDGCLLQAGYISNLRVHPTYCFCNN